MTSHDGRLVLEQERVFDATPDEVLGQLTERTALAKWWGSHGFAIPEIHVDLRVGGSLRFTMQPPDGESFHLSGETVVEVSLDSLEKLDAILEARGAHT